MSETATEAALRAVQPLAEKIATLPRLPAELPQGCSVKVDGEWCGFDGYDTATNLMHLTTGSAGFPHAPAPGETFEWSDLIGPR